MLVHVLFAKSNKPLIKGGGGGGGALENECFFLVSKDANDCLLIPLQ